MSFLDQADLDPSEFLTQELRRTDATAITDLDANPDNAVRATQLAQATGLPAPVVYGDLEHYDNQYKAGLTQQLLNNSPELRAYVAANPMASKVSNDDYGALDAVSEKVRAFADWYGAENTRLASGEKPQGTELLTTPEGRSNLGRAIAKFPEHMIRGLYQSMETAMGPGATTEDMVPFAANVAMLLEGAKLQAPWAKDLRTAAPGDIKLGRPEAERLSSTAEIIQFLKDVDTYGAQTGSKTPPHSVLIPYIQEGKPVPPGVHPTMDAAHANRAKIDAENLDGAVAEAQKSATRERDPELFANFVAQHNPGNLGVPYDVVRKLYGDKVPTPDDGILGWVPRLQEQLAVAEATGGDISIPTAEYLARVEPEVHRELKDFIRARPEGMSVEEAKTLPEADAYHGSPYEFEAFDNTKIGTGEGAQSFAYGHYLAESPDLAGFYKDKLGKKTGTEGSIYGVKLKQPKENFLVWEEDMSAQPVGQAILAKMDPVFQDSLNEFLDSHGQPEVDLLTGGMFHRALERYAEEGDLPGVSAEAVEHPKRAVAEYLSSLDVPGVAFFDKKSRSGGYMGDLDATAKGENPTRNYVVFSDKDLEIVHRNNQALEGVSVEEAKIIPHPDQYRQVPWGENDPSQTPVTFGEGKPVSDWGVKLEDGFYNVYGDGVLDNSFGHPQDAQNYIDRMQGKTTGLRPVGAGITNDNLTAPLATIRQAAGLTGPQPKPTLSLSRTGPESDGFHTFDVMDETGQQKATLDLSESTNKKTVRIEMLTAREGVGAIGPKGLSAIAEQIAKEFPLAEKIDYHHISGAKGEKPVTEIGKTTIDLAKVREKAALREQAAPQAPPQPGVLQQVQEAILGKSPEAQAAEALAMEERALFDKASAIGMTVAQYRRYSALIQQRALEDVAYAEKKALAEQKKRLTAEWKANRVDVRAEVREEINNRPEVELDEMLRGDGFKLAREGLTDEQAAAIPANYIAKEGILPDDLSSMFGDRTGGELIEKLIALLDAREAAGMKPGAYLERIVDVATDHAMEARYGALERNIIEEAKDQVLSETQESLLHEEVLARAEEAGMQLSITKDELKAAIKGFFDRLPMKEVSSDKSLAEAGRAGRAAEMALLKGDYAEAFRQKQRQFNAFTMANYAKRFEKEQARFDKTASKYKKADVPRMETATKNYIQGMLSEAGYPIKLSPEEIAASIKFEGHGTLSDYVNYLDDFGIEAVVPESVLEGGVKSLADMSVEDFIDFKDAIDSLDHIGREQRKINVAGEKQDFAVWKAKAIANLKERPIRSAEEAEKGGKWLYRIDAPWTRAEEMFKDFDMRKELGPFFEAVVMPYELSKAKSYSMLEKLSKDLRAIPGFKAKWQKTLEEKIPNDFIYDVWNETMFDLNRWNMVKMMLNWGNESNAMKLSEGILRAGREVGEKISKEEVALVHERIGDLFTKHARKEDWEFVQKIWDVFEGWKGEVDTLHRNVAGKAPKWVQGREVITPHGVFKGGYFPLIPDKLRRVGAGIKEKGQPDTGPLGQDYFRATTNQKHLKTRTGATYFVDITNGPEQLVGRMQQVIHDLAYRDFVVNAGKVLYDTEIKNAIQKHYGIEYEQQLIPWLKRVANQSNAPERELQGWNDVLKRFRGNLVASALPLNYAVMFSPSVGLLNVKKLVEFNANRAANKKLVMENSKEVPHMIYTMDRDLTEAMKAVTAKKTWSSYQLEVTEKMFKPLLWMEQQFRMATFYGEFMKQKAKGRTDFQASAIADSIVRQNHSVGAIGDLPALMASKNEFVRLSTLFMGYFTAQRNWMRQMPHYARQREWGEFGKVLWGSVIIAGLFNALLFTDRKKDEGMLSFLSRAALSVPLSGVPILRNVWNYYSQGYRSTDPISSWALAVGKLGKDGWDWLHNKPVKKPIKDVMTVLGGGVGLPGAVQIGRTGQGIYDGLTERQRPKNITEWMRLVLKGDAQLKKGN